MRTGLHEMGEYVGAPARVTRGFSQPTDEAPERESLFSKLSPVSHPITSVCKGIFVLRKADRTRMLLSTMAESKMFQKLRRLQQMAMHHAFMSTEREEDDTASHEARLAQLK